MLKVLVGGQAGQGVKFAGKVLSQIFSKLGYYVFQENDYPSLITGGHNFALLTIDKKRVNTSHHKDIDFVLALNDETYKLHKAKYYIGEGSKGFKVPLGELASKVGAPQKYKASVAIGALCYFLGIDCSILKVVFRGKKEKELNTKLANEGYSFASSNFKPVMRLKKLPKPKEMLSGNEAIAIGAIKAGLDVYIAYPMTPSTSILHFMAKYSATKDKVLTVQPENEIAVINMALGSAYAGKKTMIGTSGGGFALMTEALSLAGMAEIPLVIVEAQRAGPSTGVPTYTAQADLDFVWGAGHGDFPRIVLAPANTDQALKRTAEALSLAWKFQVPVIILSDKHLSESYMTTDLNTKVEKVKVKFSKGNMRYKITKDGVSPYVIPGIKGNIAKVNSYEHDEYGITTEDPREIKAMQDKRLRKVMSIKKEIKKLKPYLVFGNKKSKKVIITWGSTLGAVLDSGVDAKIIQVLYLRPFPDISKELKGARRIVCVEANATGQLAGLIRRELGVEVKKVLKYDSRPFDPLDLKRRLERELK